MDSERPVLVVGAGSGRWMNLGRWSGWKWTRAAKMTSVMSGKAVEMLYRCFIGPDCSTGGGRNLYMLILHRRR